MVSMKKELWGYTGFSLPTEDSWCKLSTVLDCLADQFLRNGVWLKSSTCQGFACLLNRTIIILEPKVTNSCLLQRILIGADS